MLLLLWVFFTFAGVVVDVVGDVGVAVVLIIVVVVVVNLLYELWWSFVLLSWLLWLL